MAKAKKSKAKKAKKAKTVKTKKSKARKAVKRAAAAAPRKAKKSKTAKRAAPRKAVKKPVKRAAPKAKKPVVGEGDYQASRKFLKDEANFVKRHKAEIPQMGKDAEAALAGPQGGELRAAEEEARNHSKAPGAEP